jgi:hypothetical protein
VKHADGHHLLIMLSWIRIRPSDLFRFRIWLLKLMNLFWTFGRTPWTGDQPYARPLPTQDNTTKKKRGHASSGNRTHDPSVRAVEDSACLRQRGHWGRHNAFILSTLYELIKRSVLLYNIVQTRFTYWMTISAIFSCYAMYSVRKRRDIPVHSLPQHAK